MREQAHRLVDTLSPEQLSALVHLLETMTSPKRGASAPVPSMAAILAATGYDDEEISEQTAARIAAARAAARRGELIPHEDILLEFAPGSTP